MGCGASSGASRRALYHEDSASEGYFCKEPGPTKTRFRGTALALRARLGDAVCHGCADDTHSASGSEMRISAKDETRMQNWVAGLPRVPSAVSMHSIRSRACALSVHSGHTDQSWTEDSDFLPLIRDPLANPLGSPRRLHDEKQIGRLQYFLKQKEKATRESAEPTRPQRLTPIQRASPAPMRCAQVTPLANDDVFPLSPVSSSHSGLPRQDDNFSPDEDGVGCALTPTHSSVSSLNSKSTSVASSLGIVAPDRTLPKFKLPSLNIKSCIAYQTDPPAGFGHSHSTSTISGATKKSSVSTALSALGKRERDIRSLPSLDKKSSVSTTGTKKETSV